MVMPFFLSLHSHILEARQADIHLHRTAHTLHRERTITCSSTIPERGSFYFNRLARSRTNKQGLSLDHLGCVNTFRPYGVLCVRYQLLQLPSTSPPGRARSLRVEV